MRASTVLLILGVVVIVIGLALPGTAEKTECVDTGLTCQDVTYEDDEPNGGVKMPLTVGGGLMLVSAIGLGLVDK